MATIARYGHQDILKLTGRKDPLTRMELYLFEMALLECLEAESVPLPSQAKFEPRD